MYVKNLIGRIFSRGPVSVTLAVVLSVLFVTGVVGAATTISTNINTAGTLTVTGASTLTGNVSAAGTLAVTGVSTLTGTSTHTAGAIVGSSGTAINQIIKGTCDLLGMNASHAASTTKAYNCAVTGVLSGDLVFAQLGTSTPFTGPNQWIIVGAVASSTAGYIDVLIWHGGDIPVAPSISGVGSSTRYLIIR